MPTIEELHAMAMAIYNMGFDEMGCGFETLRDKVMALALNAKRNDLLAAIQNDTDSIVQVVWNR